MANIDVEVGGRRYDVACRDGEEEHLRSVAAIVDRKAQDAAAALGSLSETRQLLFAALLLADEHQGDPRRRRHPPSRAAAARSGRRRGAGTARRADGSLADSLERSAASA